MLPSYKRFGTYRSHPQGSSSTFKMISNNKVIYEVKAIQNKIIQIQTPLGLPTHPYHNAWGASNMGTRANVTNHTSVSNAEDITTVQTVLNPATPQQNVPCVEGHNPANYKGCEHYHNILQGYNPHRIPYIHLSVAPAQDQCSPTSPAQPTAIPTTTTATTQLCGSSKQQC